MELRLPLEMSPGKEAAFRAVFGPAGYTASPSPDPQTPAPTGQVLSVLNKKEAKVTATSRAPQAAHKAVWFPQIQDLKPLVGNLLATPRSHL